MRGVRRRVGKTRPKPLLSSSVLPTSGWQDPLSQGPRPLAVTLLTWPFQGAAQEGAGTVRAGRVRRSGPLSCLLSLQRTEGNVRATSFPRVRANDSRQTAHRLCGRSWCVKRTQSLCEVPTESRETDTCAWLSSRGRRRGGLGTEVCFFGYWAGALPDMQ